MVSFIRPWNPCSSHYRCAKTQGWKSAPLGRPANFSVRCPPRHAAGRRQGFGRATIHHGPPPEGAGAAREAILGHVERIEAEILAIEHRVSGRDIRLEGTVRVSTIEILALEVRTPAFARLQREHPGIVLVVAAEARSVSVTRREADIALRLVRLTQNELAVRRVGAIGFGVYASADYLERLGQPDFPSGAPGHATVLNPVETMGLPEMVWFAGLMHQAVPAIRHNSRYGHRAAAEAGMGLAMLSRFMGDTARLVRLEPPAPQPPRDVFLGVHNDIRHTPRIRAVIDAIAASMRAKAGRLVPDVI
jgi:DNA-binding transcriptional LysR family regulator